MCDLASVDVLLGMACLQCDHHSSGWFQSITGAKCWWRFDTLCYTMEVGRHALLVLGAACVFLHPTAVHTIFETRVCFYTADMMVLPLPFDDI